MTSDIHPSTATRGLPRVALVTCAELPDLDPDDRLLVPELAARGIEAVPVAWDDPGVDWSRFALSVLRSAWDYPTRRPQFLDWAHRVPRLANPAGVVAWSTDKRYLDDLAAAGVPIVPTTWLEPGTGWLVPEGGHHVVKPAVGAGSLDTGRYDHADPHQRDLSRAHVDRLHAAGRPAMLQPYLHAVDTVGETALLYLDGLYSHAIRKGAMLDGPARAIDGLYRPETITSREPSAAERRVAEAALAAAARATGQAVPPLYARVDLIPDGAGRPLLVELELAEPSLFMGTTPDAAARLAEAIARRLPVPVR